MKLKLLMLGAAAAGVIQLSGCASVPAGSIKVGYGLISVEANWQPAVQTIVVKP